MVVNEKSVAALDAFLESKEADLGLLSDTARELIYKIPGDEDEAYKYFVNYVVSPQSSSDFSTKSIQDEKEPDDENNNDDIILAAKSYRAMNILKQDLSMPGYPSMLIKNPAQAGLLAKELFSGLANTQKKRYTTLHIRELLDALVEAYPEKVMAAASAGGKQGIQEHLGPLLASDQTLPVLTHLVCYGCTGRKGIASAEKSAQHTASMYQNLQYNNGKSKISMGQRKKFVRACMDFDLLPRLSDTLIDTESSQGLDFDAEEEICEAILTMIELIGYPPDDGMQQIQNGDNKEDVVVGEDILLSPLASMEWWMKLLGTVREPFCSPQKRLAIARTCMQSFALATGNSSRICKSHAPATDATEQTTEQIVQEKEEKLRNRLIEWGLTDNIHESLVAQIPLLVQSLNLPTQDILSYSATFFKDLEEFKTENPDQTIELICHPGGYQTIPLGSWRLQLLALLKEIVVYRNQSESSEHISQPIKAMNAIMELPLPPEFVKTKKGEEEKKVEADDTITYNPWPALCSYLWAYPNNDFYSIVFFEMLRSAILEHHEATLRVILQKSKFLTRAVKTLTSSSGARLSILLNCLNLLRLRAQSLPPNAFLPQYLSSHDGWKEHVDKLIEMTLLQEKPIKDDGQSLDIGLGSNYAKTLGLGELKEYDSSLVPEALQPGIENDGDEQDDGKKKANIKKKKKGSKKKKK